MSNYTQEGRLFKIDTPLGKDVLLLRGFTGTERISRLFSFSLDLLSENSSISFSDIIGKNVTISLKQLDGSYRYLNGIISRFAQLCDGRRVNVVQCRNGALALASDPICGLPHFQKQEHSGYHHASVQRFGFPTITRTHCKLLMNR